MSVNLRLTKNRAKTKMSIIGHTEGKLELSGVFVPDVSEDIFTPVFNWIKEQPETNKKKSLEVVFKVFYATPSSLNNIYSLIKLLDNLAKDHEFTISAYWLYTEDDEDSEEEGEDIRDFFVRNFSFRLIAVDRLENYI